MSEKLYNVGMYIRLSKENTAYSGEDSTSIENQQAMLSKFIAMMPGWVEKRTYIDNGASGGNFNRQGFRDMMTDIRNDEINLVLVQDLSRFGRNYLESGKYLEEELPALGCRFVALADGIDTDTGENDIMPFLNAMNDFYLKNLSDRIKSVFQAKANNGHKLTGPAPYGYTRNPDDHTKLVVDDYAAEVVRRIFQMRANGFGYGKIVGALNGDNIAPPRLHYYLRQGKEPSKTCSKLWQFHAITTIVRDEHYLGHTISCKYGRSYRDGKGRSKPESQWIKVENTHEPIVDEQTWEMAQEVNERLSKWVENKRQPRPSLFSGKIFCADCMVNMTPYSQKRYKDRDERRNTYACKTYAVTGRQSCSRHAINEDTLKALILEHIKAQAKLIQLDEDAMLRSLCEKLKCDMGTDKAITQKQLLKLKQEVHSLDVRLEQYYEDKITGTISPETFSRLASKTEVERTEIVENIASLEHSEKEAKAKLHDIQRWVSLVKEYSGVTDVDRDFIETLIERVEVGESRIENGVKTQDVRIVYRFVGVV